MNWQLPIPFFKCASFSLFTSGPRHRFNNSLTRSRFEREIQKMAEIVYVLCAVTSFFCAGLLYRGYKNSKARFLLWSSGCFLGFAANNMMVIVDLVLTGREMDLSVWRILPALFGVAFILYGFVMGTE